MFNKEQLKQLKELGVIAHFDTVLDSQFKRGTFKNIDEQLANIYEEASGKKVSRNFNCKTCVFNLYKEAGLLYRKTLDFNKQENLRKAREAKQNKQKEKLENEQN